MAMNGAELHFLINHFPVIGFIGLIPALIAAIKVRSVDIKQFVLIATCIVGCTSLAAYWTGEPAEDTIKTLPGVEKARIETHEEAAQYAMAWGVATGVAAGAALMLARRRVETLRKTLPVVLGMTLMTAAATGMTAHHGGKIRHPEIRATPE